MPTQNITMLVPFNSAEKACEAVSLIFQEGFTPSALEFMERDAIDWTLKYTDIELYIPEHIQAHLLIEIDGNDLGKLYNESEQISNMIMQKFCCKDILVADTKDQKGFVKSDLYSVKPGKARVITEGNNITIVGISNMVVESIKAQKYLQDIGISAEVIDPIWLSPLDLDTIENIINVSTSGIRPDITIFLSVAPDKALGRVNSQLSLLDTVSNSIEKENPRMDVEGSRRFELESINFHKRVFQGYVAMSKDSSWLTVDATKSVDEIHNIIWDKIQMLIK